MTAFTYQTPKFTANKLVRQVVGGWTWGGILRYASGSLIGVPLLAHQPQHLHVQHQHPLQPRARRAAVPRRIRIAAASTRTATQQILNPAAWADTPVGTWGQGAAYYNDYRWQHQINEIDEFRPDLPAARENVAAAFGPNSSTCSTACICRRRRNSNPTAPATFNSAGVPTGGFGYITNSSGIGGQRNGQLVARFQF